MSNGWGTPKYGHGTTNHFNIKKGKFTFRILPPMKSCSDDGYGWYRYHGIHFGWSGTDSKDPAKTRIRPFRCVKKENRSKGIVEQDCPACDLIDTQKNAFEALKAQLVSAGTPEDEVKTQVAPLEDWLKQYNLDWKCYVNVMTPANEFGDLKINHKFHKKGIDTQIAKLGDQKIDPLALDQGVWFEINRTTMDGNDAVDVVQEPFVMEGKTFYSPKKAPLDEALSNRALDECPDLNTIGFELSYEQIKALVESSGEPEDVDKIFAMSQKADTPKVAPAPVPARVATPAPTPAPTPAVATPLSNTSSTIKPAVLNPNDPAVQARLAQIRAKKEVEAKALADAKAAEAAKLASQKASAPAPEQKAEDPTAAMSDEDFLAFAAAQQPS